MKSFLNIAKFAIAFVLVMALAQTFGAGPELAAGISFAINAVAALVPAQAGVLGTFVGINGITDSESAIQVVASEPDRVTYEHNKNKPEFKDRAIAPGFLRLETDIVNSKNELIFKTYDGDGSTVYPTERRLDRNDAFIASEMGLFLLRQDTANEKTNAELHSYVNLTSFVAAVGFVPGDLKAIFNGYLKISVGRAQKIVALDTQRFYKVPETQQTGPTNYDQKDGNRDGFIKCTPQIVVDGNGTNEISVTFPSFAGWAGASVTAGTTHKLCLYLRGLLVPGGNRA